MLGFPSHNEPIKEPFASQIREALIRHATKNYNLQEIEQIKRSKRINKMYKAVWLDENGNKIKGED